jgi:hypothetical protein
MLFKCNHDRLSWHENKKLKQIATLSNFADLRDAFDLTATLVQAWQKTLLPSRTVEPTKNDDDIAASKSSSDDGFVPASLLDRERFEDLTALKRWLEKLPSGKVRSRKPSPQRLEIHNADWTRYWAEEDRLKSEALDEESLQETIANIEARKHEERTKKEQRKTRSKAK